MLSNPTIPAIATPEPILKSAAAPSRRLSGKNYRTRLANDLIQLLKFDVSAAAPGQRLTNN
jgi:hypothetical protein